MDQQLLLTGATAKCQFIWFLLASLLLTLGEILCSYSFRASNDKGKQADDRCLLTVEAI